MILKLIEAVRNHEDLNVVAASTFALNKLLEIEIEIFDFDQFEKIIKLKSLELSLTK